MTAETVLIGANIVLVLITGTYAAFTYGVMAATRRLAASTEAMAEATRSLAQGQVSARVTLEFKTWTPRTDEERRLKRSLPASPKLYVANRGPGWAFDVRLMSNDGSWVRDLRDLSPQSELSCAGAESQTTLELHWRDGLRRESDYVVRYCRNDDEDWGRALARG